MALSSELSMIFQAKTGQRIGSEAKNLIEVFKKGKKAKSSKKYFNRAVSHAREWLKRSKW